MKRWDIKDLTLGGLFTALIAVGAFLKITIPVQPVPMHFTLQFFFVLLAALLLGSKRAFASVITYLVIGLCGLPIFATGGGPAYLLKPTFGFLIGFAAAAFVTGRVYEIRKSTSFFWLLFSAFWGLLADYACGMIYYYIICNFVIGTPIAFWPLFLYCFLLAVPGDICLCFVGAFLAKRLRPAYQRIQS